MIPRRISTILAWLKTLNIIEQKENEKYYLLKSIITTIPIIDYNDIDQPIIPSTADLQEYETVEQRVLTARDMILIYKSQAKLDRANSSHAQLVNLVADRIRSAGGIPKSNQIIDLATTMNEDFIFEMKSTNENNVKAQVRKGISQLYEYRYLQNKPNANLILVVERPLEGDNSWMIDYMENDRNIHLVWDGDNNLYGTAKTREQLGFLGLKAS